MVANFVKIVGKVWRNFENILRKISHQFPEKLTTSSPGTTASSTVRLSLKARKLPPQPEKLRSSCSFSKWGRIPHKSTVASYQTVSCSSKLCKLQEKISRLCNLYYRRNPVYSSTERSPKVLHVSYRGPWVTSTHTDLYSLVMPNDTKQNMPLC